MNEFFFKRSKEALDVGVVETGSSAGETRQHPPSRQLTLIGVGGVLGEFNRSSQRVSELMIADRQTLLQVFSN